MKRKLLYLGSVLFFVLVGTGLWFQLNSIVEPFEEEQHLKEKTSWTPRELLEQEIEAKKKRRDAGYAKADKPNEYTKFHEAIRTKWGADAPEYSVSYKFRELEKARLKGKSKKSYNVRGTLLDWEERGPANVPGRTRGLLVLPDDPEKNTWLAGSVAGGIWKTTDGGLSWESLTPELANMATTSLVMAAENPQIIYAGTGESFAGYNGVNGDGIFKSENGGASWAQLASTTDNNDFRNVNRLLVDQTNSDILIAVTSPSYWGNGDASSKIMKTTNGGQSWKKVYESNRSIEQVVAHPDNFNIQYASINGSKVIKSSDAGETWSNTGDFSTSGRIELAIAPSNPDRLYALTQGFASGSGSDLFTSADAGNGWELVASLDGDTEYDYLGGQGWYDNTIAVNPYDDAEAYLGGVNMFRVRLGEAGISEPGFKGVAEENTASFLSFVNFGQTHFNGALAFGDLDPSEMVSVEVRFGIGQEQKAHRFTVPANGGTSSDGGAGVNDSDYSFQDYVTVPFEVWDVDNDQRLMVSFRDQERDGEFNLKDRQHSGEEMLDNREYIYIHAAPYAETPSEGIATNGGQLYRQMYFTWPTLTENASWIPAELPESKLIIKYGTRESRDRNVSLVADAYGNFAGPNGFTQQTNETEVTGMHPDHHNITMIPMDAAAKTFKILVGNDGGVFVSNTSDTPGIEEGDWTFAGNGYNTTQFYGVDKMPGKDVYIGGTQDNGTWRSPIDASADATTHYYRALGGDGFEVVWNYDNPNMMMGSVYYNSISRSLDGGETWANATNGLSDNGEENAPFITKLANHKSRPNAVYALGASGVWRTLNFGGKWSLTPITEQWLSSTYMDVEISQANPYIVWAGSGMIPDRASLHVSVDGGESFSKTTNHTTENLGIITGISTHPTEDSTAYALFSFANSPKILRTQDLGKTWEDISGFEGNEVSSNGFPDVAVYSLLVMPHDPNIIWAGTEIGIIESTDNGKNWYLAENGFANLAVWDMKVVDDQIVIGTHARGIWTVTIPELPEIVRSPVINNIVTAPTQSLNMQLSLRSEYDSVHFSVDGELLRKMGATQEKDTLVNLTYVPANNKAVKVEVTGYKRKVKYVSEAINFKAVATPDPVSSYATDFAKDENEFSGANYSISLPSGFRNHALHSKHPYDHNSDNSSQLIFPIIVAEEDAEIRYEDIVLVEGASPGAVFGEEAFNDYVVVEGTKDGLHWQPLADGYNSSSKEDWKLAMQSNAKPEADLFKPQTINLHNTYTAGDIIFIRFRLYSNTAGNGYGWVVDNLRIQNNKPLGFNEGMLSGQFSLEAFPNPATSHSNIHYYIPQASEMILTVFDINGALVEQVQLGFQPAGDHLFSYQLPPHFRQGQLMFGVLRTEKGDTKSIRILKK